MKLETSEENGIGTARLEGSLDGKTAPEVREQLKPFLAANCRDDPRSNARSTISPAPACGCCCCSTAKLSARKGKLVLLGVSDDIRTVMSHTGFLNFFTLAGSEAEAMNRRLA